MRHFSLQDISTYRSAVLGISMVWIVLYHFKFSNNLLQIPVRYGYTGVDIFVFMSGFGLFFSMARNPSLKHFYIKRFLRILPTYYLIGALLSLFWYHDDVITYLYRCSMLGYWICRGEIYFDWFIPAIVILYLVFPWNYHKIINPFNKKCFIGAIIIFELLSAFYLFMPYTDNWHFLFIYRIPAFLIGCYTASQIGKDSYQKNFERTATILIIPAILLLSYGYIYHNTPISYYATSFLCPFIIIIFALFAKHIKMIEIVGKKIGVATLEIYLVHLFLLRVTKTMDFRLEYHDLSTIFLLIISVILGILLHKMLSIIIIPIEDKYIHSIS